VPLQRPPRRGSRSAKAAQPEASAKRKRDQPKATPSGAADRSIRWKAAALAGGSLADKRSSITPASGLVTLDAVLDNIGKVLLAVLATVWPTVGDLAAAAGDDGAISKRLDTMRAAYGAAAATERAAELAADGVAKARAQSVSAGPADEHLADLLAGSCGRLLPAGARPSHRLRPARRTPPMPRTLRKMAPTHRPTSTRRMMMERWTRRHLRRRMSAMNE
jgi:hypothetical protein